MFCHRKSTLADLIWQPIGFLMALIGVMTVAGALLCQMGKLKGNCRRLAKQCGQAVENAAGAVADVMDSCCSSFSQGNSAQNGSSSSQSSHQSGKGSSGQSSGEQ